MQNLNRIFVTSALLVITAVTAGAQDSVTKNTLRLTEGAKRPAAKISDLGWMSGYWRGQGLGGDLEEIWSLPSGDRMHGVFSLARGGEPVFSEAMLFVEEERSLVLKVKHFSPEFVGWEEKDESVRFPLVGIADNEAYFNGLTFRRDGDKLLIYIVLTQGDEKTEHELRLERLRN
jgi:hypothetical protein